MARYTAWHCSHAARSTSWMGRPFSLGIVPDQRSPIGAALPSPLGNQTPTSPRREPRPEISSPCRTAPRRGAGHRRCRLMLGARHGYQERVDLDPNGKPGPGSRSCSRYGPHVDAQLGLVQQVHAGLICSARGDWSTSTSWPVMPRQSKRSCGADLPGISRRPGLRTLLPPSSGTHRLLQALGSGRSRA
jgi:hypothetical protein